MRKKGLQNTITNEQAFLLQFEGNEYDLREKLGLEPFGYNGCPIYDMKQTGLFGIIDSLIDMELTGYEILDFYVHGHVEPYTDPYLFTKGIIEIVHGMTKEEIKNKYGRYFEDKKIKKLANLNNNTKMLLSFCCNKDDMYEFIPDKEDLYTKFLDRYDLGDSCNYCEERNKFQKIDGNLFRTVRFLVRQGYDFPEIDSLFNKRIKNIVFKQKNGKKELILNKKHAREVGDNLLSLIYFCNKNNYKFLNPEEILNLKSRNIILVDPNGKQIMLDYSYLVPNLNKYVLIIERLNNKLFDVSDISVLYDRRIKNIEVKYTDKKSIEHILNVKRDILLEISEDLLYNIKIASYLGFDFLDGNNLFNKNEKLIEVIDPNGKKQLVLRDKFDSILDIIIKCEKLSFSVNYTQLFDLNHDMVDIYDIQGKMGAVNRNQIINITRMFSLLRENGYSVTDYNNLFDEKEPYIICDDNQIISRKQMNKIVEIEDSHNNNLTDDEANLSYMLKNHNIRKKLFSWLPYTAKKWIPSSAVINKIPPEKSYEYFYNNNHLRLKALKDEYRPKNYEEMEGIVSIGYILGLFDSKESVSIRAMNYIIDYFLKKGITAYELHTTYGAIDLKKGYDKKFADFFMKHYSVDSNSFIEADLGTDMTGELFERFDEVLEKRPEKKIKTRTINKLLTPMDAMAVITNFEINEKLLGEKIKDKRYVELVQLLMKFGAKEDELNWAIQLYEEALKIDEQKVLIPYIEDTKGNLMKFNSHLKNDSHVFLSGRKTNCCSRYGGYAQDRLTHVITDLNWRYVTFTSLDTTFFDGIVWYDDEEQVVCIDNVEGKFGKKDKQNSDSVAMMADTIIRYADDIYYKMNELGIPCKKVNVGKDRGTASWKIFNYAEQMGLIYEDDCPCHYPRKNHITTDAYNQFTITNKKSLDYRKKLNK